MSGPGPEDDPDLTYPGAPDSVIASWQSRRGPVLYGRNESLPPLDIDLAALRAETVPQAEPDLPKRRSHYMRKLLQLRAELAGKSELAALNADLIVHLRRESFPDHAPALFRRIWREEGPALIAELPSRWLISSIITFADHGETEAQRRLGQSLNILFSLMKLYEFERLFSGTASDQPFTGTPPKGSPLPMGMQRFGMTGGGLDRNLLAPIWQDAMQDPVAGPLACHLLDRLNADPRTLFRRIRLMRAARGDADDTAPDHSGADRQL
ncbi:MAG: hypothetical protein MUE83_16675 [Tabrizicola sp.]|nr:hypothetical protein [Tabrizicola sp.]